MSSRYPGSAGKSGLGSHDPSGGGFVTVPDTGALRAAPTRSPARRRGPVTATQHAAQQRARQSPRSTISSHPCLLRVIRHRRPAGRERMRHSRTIDPDRLAEDLEFSAAAGGPRVRGIARVLPPRLETIIKDDDTPVSEADLETDRRMVELIKAERPDDGS